jgi:tRNA dimethylallyltransferase
LRAKKAVFVFGPTAVGKSYIAERVALKLGYEIINMDIGSFLSPLIVGTAKPDIAECPVRCHLFDILDEPQEFSVVDYRKKVIETICQMSKREVTPLFVGGSSFYLKSLFFPPVSDLRQRNHEAVKHIFSKGDLWGFLNSVDPVRAGAIDPHDLYRIKRALSIWSDTEQLPSDYAPQYDPLFKKSIVVFVDRDRQDLYNRINDRVDNMMRKGLLSEALLAYQHQPWKDYLKWKKIIGYAELFEFLRGSDRSSSTLKNTVDRIKQRTRNYAKRQITFWRMLKKELNAVTTKGKRIIIKEINLSTIPASEHAEKIVSLI